MGVFKPCYWVVQYNSMDLELDRRCVMASDNEDTDQAAMKAILCSMVTETVLAHGDSFMIEEGETET